MPSRPAYTNPAVFTLRVALAASNAFLPSTHQVNALIMCHGDYREDDFLPTGTITGVTAAYATRLASVKLAILATNNVSGVILPAESS